MQKLRDPYSIGSSHSDIGSMITDYATVGNWVTGDDSHIYFAILEGLHVLIIPATEQEFQRTVVGHVG